MDALSPTTTTGTQQAVSKDHTRHIYDLQALCSERRNNAQRALEALNRQLDYLAKRHTIRKAKSIKILTILASLYLPLSLSASLLGMQTPFKLIAHDNKGSTMPDLTGTNLLFDFLGVFIWLSTTTIFIVYTIRLGLWQKSKRTQFAVQVLPGPVLHLYLRQAMALRWPSRPGFRDGSPDYGLVDQRPVLDHTAGGFLRWHAENGAGCVGHGSADVCHVYSDQRGSDGCLCCYVLLFMLQDASRAIDVMLASFFEFVCLRIVCKGC